MSMLVSPEGYGALGFGPQKRERFDARSNQEKVARVRLNTPEPVARQVAVQTPCSPEKQAHPCKVGIPFAVRVIKEGTSFIGCKFKVIGPTRDSAPTPNLGDELIF